MDTGYLDAAPHHGVFNGTGQDELCKILLKARPGGGHGPAPACQQSAIGQPDTGLCHILTGDNGLQRLLGNLFVMEYHGRFTGVTDGTRHQLKVVVRIDTQGQQSNTGQQQTGHTNSGQGRHHVGASQALSQGEPLRL